MTWDACLARAVAAELAEQLAGRRWRGTLLDRETRQASVWFRDLVLAIDLRPGRGFVLIEPGSEPPEGADSPAAVLAEVEAPPDERAVVLRFRRRRGAGPAPALVADFATNRWNVLLAEGPELRVRKRLVATRARTHRIGARWAPAAGGRRTALSASEWAAALSEARPEKRLLAQVAYASSLNAGHLAGAPTPEEGLARWTALADGRRTDPCVLRLPGGGQPYPCPLSAVEATPAPTLLDAMREAAREEPGAAGPNLRAARLLEAQARRLARKAGRLREEIARAGAANALRDDATLVLSSLHAIPPGAREATLNGFDGRPRTVAFPPKTRPQDHAAALFRRAARMERALPGLASALRAAERALAQTEEMRRRNDLGSLTTEEAAALGRPRPGAGPPALVLPYRAYRSSGGLEIRVGRGARRNDQLTFRHARPNDIWLHARHAAGAHVVLRWNRTERPPAADLEQAAVLAANHSRARGSGHVPVDWTRRKWVRKPRGSPPGVVAPERVETLFAAPDLALETRLAAMDERGAAT